MRGLGASVKDAWRLARPYFASSEEKWSARALLAIIIALNLALVGMDVVLNFWNGAFYNSLQHRDWHAFVQLLFFYYHTSGGMVLPGFCGVAAVYILVAVYRTFLRQWLQIRWRRWMTRGFVDAWLADRAYYRISLTGDPQGVGTDNPDQRIADDVASFVADTLALGLDLLSNVVSLASFVGILWTLSGAITVFGLGIPGYMVWVALLYAGVGTWLTHLVGRPLTALNFRQQRFEADFRFSLARLRENTEGVALYGGEAEENAGLATRFSAVVGNWWAIMQRTKALNALVSGYSQVAVVFPIIVAAPRYFAGKIALGGLTRTASAFGQVQGAMSWFVGAYASLAVWRAEVERLAAFDRAVTEARASAGQGVALAADGERMRLEDVTLKLPDGAVLLDHASVEFRPGQSVVITGRSGSGKSTLFRALAGIWPFGSGRVALPAGRCLFLPQRPYLPQGSLRRAVTYPAAPEAIAEAVVAEALSAVGLGALGSRLDTVEPWALRLSGGEQQRLAIARALVNRPDWLFLDEATTSLDPEAEAELYRLLRERLPATTLVSVAHRETVAALHERRLRVERPGQGAGHLVEPVAEAAAE